MNGNDDILNARILAVDDEPVGLNFLKVNLQARGFRRVTVCTDPRQALEVMKDIMPDVLLLDLVMPELDGFGFMELARRERPGEFLPILVISGQGDSESKRRALEAGARDFITKPFDMVEVAARVRNMAEMKRIYDQLRGQNRELEEKVAARTENLHNTFREVLNSLSTAMEYHNKETGDHLKRIRDFISILARGSGVENTKAERLADASVMHDIGKIGVPEGVLVKAGPLTAQEWELMKNHTVIGADILAGYDSGLIHVARNIALTHHEKWNGTGYPRGLVGIEIPLEGRMVSLCDAFDALLSERPYKPAWPMDEAVKAILAERGRSFDPNLVDVFEALKDEFIEAARVGRAGEAPALRPVPGNTAVSRQNTLAA